MNCQNLIDSRTKVVNEKRTVTDKFNCMCVSVCARACEDISLYIILCLFESIISLKNFSHHTSAKTIIY